MMGIGLVRDVLGNEEILVIQGGYGREKRK